MSLVRKNIRQAVVTALAGISATVYESRIYPIEILPAVSVYTPKEVREEDAQVMGRDVDARELSITVEIRVQATADIENELDDICSEVITAINGDSDLGALVDVVQYDDYDTTMLDDLDNPTALGVISFTAYYRTVFNNPDIRA